LRYLNDVAGDCEDIAASFAVSERSIVEKSTRSHRRRPGRRGRGPLVGREDEVERLFQRVDLEEKRGRFGSVPLARLAQALLNPADAYVLLKAPTPATAPFANWLIDRDLDKLVESGRLSILGEISHHALGPDHHLLGAVVTTYSDNYDVRVIVEYVHRLDSLVSGPARPSVLNGRSVLQFHMDELAASPGAEDQLWLTRRIGGLFSLLDASMELFPASEWIDDFSWYPDPLDPTRWLRDGLEVARLERIVGPLRDIGFDDSAHRTPMLTRWVCTTNEWERISRLIGGEPSMRVDVEHGSFDLPD